MYVHIIVPQYYPNVLYTELVQSFFKFFDNLGTGKSCFSFLFSLQTGKSKGYAFVEFYSDEVAKVVADTMDNYLVFERIVKCKLKNLKNNKFKFCTPDTTNMSLNSLKFG